MTRPQLDVLRFIVVTLDASGLVPTQHEIAAALGRTQSTVAQHIARLRQAELIEPSQGNHHRNAQPTSAARNLIRKILEQEQCESSQ